jgi:peptidoglycan hydrolase-like protein with peptidoglycan-binding domain/tetratricopeptide (TPR) repeat protein
MPLNLARVVTRGPRLTITGSSPRAGRLTETLVASCGAAASHDSVRSMLWSPGGLRLPKKPRTAAWRALAISVLALAFPATAVAATGPAEPAASAPIRASSASPRAANSSEGRPVLTLGSGYGARSGSPTVRVLQRALVVGGYPPGRLDGLYGPRTRRAVLAFQASHGLHEDGVVGPRTWAALSEPILILGPGAADQPDGENVVRSLQRHLAAAGSSPGPIDGRYGVLTEAAVRRFQNRQGLPATGIAGPRTLALLDTPERSVRQASPLSHKHAPSVTRSRLSSRPTGSTVEPAPRARPASGAHKVPGATARRPSSESGPWTILLLGLALVLALALAARLLIPFLRHTARRSASRSGDAETANSDVRSAELKRTGFTTTNGHHEAVARTNGTQILTNGHRANANGNGIGNGANNQPSRGDENDLPGAVETASAFNLGQVLPGHGGVVEAHAANGHADQRDHGTAASNLGRLLEEQGALAEAEAAYRRADELGDSAGAFHLGLLLEGQGGVVDAQAAYGRADQRGHGAAASNLGRLLAEQGALAEAEAAYRRADERGDAEGAYRLGVLLRDRGALDGAAAAYDRASGRGHNAAAVDLGVLYAEHGALAEAESAFRCAGERGDAAAAFNLGVLLEQRGALADAMAAYRRAQQSDDGEVADLARAALSDLGRAVAETGSVHARRTQHA